MRVADATRGAEGCSHGGPYRAEGRLMTHGHTAHASGSQWSQRVCGTRSRRGRTSMLS